MKQLLPGFYMLTRPMGVNMVLIEDPDGLTLIDTSLAFTVKGVLQDIGRLGRQPADLKRILITHAHPDHVGGLAELKRLTGAQVIASELERPVIEGKFDVLEATKAVAILAKMMKPAPVDRVVADCDVIETFGGMQALLTPGHAPGHLCFWQPEKKVLVAGDVMFNLLGLTLPPAFLSVDMDEDRRSVLRVAALEPAMLVVGHGPPVVKDTARKLRAFADKVGAALRP